MEGKKLKICSDHKERNGVLNYICCSEECQAFLCDFCLKGHQDHQVFSLSQLHYHRQVSEGSLHLYRTEFREKSKALFDTLESEIVKIINKNRNEFLAYLDNAASKIIDFQNLYDEFERHPSLNTKMLKKYTEIRNILNHNILQYQIQFIKEQVNDFIESNRKKIANFREYLEKDVITNFNNIEIKSSVRVREAKGYNPSSMKIIGDDLVVTGSKNGVLCLWDYEKTIEKSRRIVDGEISCLEYAKDHQLLFCGTPQSIQVYTIQNKALIKKKILRVNTEVNNILYVGSNILVTSEKQFGIVLRNVKNLTAIAKFRLNDIYSISYIQSRKKILLDSSRGLSYLSLAKRTPSHFVAIGDLNLASRSCHGLHYLKNWQTFIVPINSRKVAQLRNDLSLERKIDTSSNIGLANRPCAFISNEDESQTVITSVSSGLCVIEKDTTKFVQLDAIRKSSAVLYVKEKRTLIVSEFEEEKIFIIKLKSIFDSTI